MLAHSNASLGTLQYLLLLLGEQQLLLFQLLQLSLLVLQFLLVYRVQDDVAGRQRKDWARLPETKQSDA